MLENTLVLSLLGSLIFTLIVEYIFALIWGVRGWGDLLLVGLVNIATNPPVVLTHNLIRLSSPVFFTIALELTVVAVEGYCYKSCGKSIKKPFLLSVGANLLSYVSGLLLMKLI